MTGPALALIPVNRLDRAKQRLAELLTAEERRELALITFRTVAEAAAGAGWTVVLLTDDPVVRGAAPPGARLLAEAPGLRGLNAQLEAAVERIRRELGNDGDPRLLILHADLPLANTEAIRRLGEADAPAPSATAVRSGDGGTNAMLLRPPGLFPLAYGESSFGKHAEAAAGAAVSFGAFESEELSLDLDTPADIGVLLSTAPGRASAAGRYLMHTGAEERLAAARPREG